MTIGSAEFEQFVAARWPALFRTAYLLTGDARLAEDVTQSALANTYARRARIRDAHALEAYVRRAQTNLVISASRRPGHRGEQLTDAPPERGGSDDIAHATERLDLREALDRLSPRQRAVVVLRFYDDLSVAQVAQTLGCSEGNVKKVTHEAIQRLRGLVPVDLDSDLLGELSEGSAR
ncbi:MAG: SigE family RNA polymerase sigma factor [Nocardioidaceae bacterium]